ncbi:MAG: class I SAM-dependent methyltransferase [Burkholderiales bacterium]|nr:class I SAM-dependent methyltransferase [Burkholderiales bacterium]
MNSSYLSFVLDLLRRLLCGDADTRKYLGQRIALRLRRAFGGSASRSSDDYDWETYATGYRSELCAMEKAFVLALSPGDYAWREGALERRGAALPLHPNHWLLYDTILRLGPRSALELGCGGGDHLHNLHLLDPSLALHGVDRSQGQLELLRARHPGLAARVRAFDATLPFPDAMDRVDLAFTQAVVMHIHAGNGHLVALSNLFRAARSQVVMMENWERHAFVSDIRLLHALGIVPWERLHIYFRASPRQPDTRILVASAQPLEWPDLAEATRS